MKIHCLFEQSGTFKNVFKKLGYDAFDYDIDNVFNETDFQLDLFNEIENAALHKKSVFDNFGENDLVFAFFPCTYFSTQNNLFWSGKAIQLKNLNDDAKEKYILNRKINRSKHFKLLNKFIDICNDRNIKLIIENPYHDNYLLKKERFSNPDVVIMNRALLGDYYIKPTMFFFFNLEPATFSIDFLFQNNKVNKQIPEINSQIERSLIHPTFAYNFIQKYIFGVA